MIQYEWKKLLFRRKGLLLTLLFLLAELVGTVLFTQPYDAVLEDNRSVYESYLSVVEGPLTQEKRDYIEHEMQRLNAVHRDLEQLKGDYYGGLVTEEVYRENFDRLAAEDAGYIGFSKLYSQYIYVREAEDRSFLYTGGWEVLLTDQEPDYLFLLMLIILLTPIFCEEYACRMHEMLLTQKRSARYQVMAKLTVALSLAFMLTVVLQLFDLVYSAVQFGLPNGSFTLQSVRSFGGTSKQLTLWQAFWLQFALKELGYLYAAVLILCLSVLLKKFALTLMASIAILPLPFLTVTSNNVFLCVPGPWALTIGSIYLNSGTQELKWEQLVLLLLGVLAIISIMLHIIRMTNTNWQLTKRCPHTIAVLIFLISMLLSGCDQGKETVIYNRSTANQYETNAYLLNGSYEGATITEKTTGNTYAFPVSPLQGEIITCGSTFYGIGNTVYYLRTTTHQPNAGWDTISTNCDLVKLNLDTMEESVVYQWNEEANWFFGLLDFDSTVPTSFVVELLFIHGNEMYYVDISKFSLNKMDLITGQYEVVLPSLNSQDIAYDGTNLYYLDVYNRLVIREIEGGEERPNDNVVAKQFLLVENGIYFHNCRDNSALYFWNFAEQRLVKLSDAN